MIYQVKYKSATINYVVVDRKKSVLSIKHKMNIKTAITGNIHHPYHPEMNFGGGEVKFINQKIYGK